MEGGGETRPPQSSDESKALTNHVEVEVDPYVQNNHDDDNVTIFLTQIVCKQIVSIRQYLVLVASLKPLAKGLLSIFNFVICKWKKCHPLDFEICARGLAA